MKKIKWLYFSLGIFLLICCSLIPVFIDNKLIKNNSGMLALYLTSKITFLLILLIFNILISFMNYTHGMILYNISIGTILQFFSVFIRLSFKSSNWKLYGSFIYIFSIIFIISGFLLGYLARKKMNKNFDNVNDNNE